VKTSLRNYRLARLTHGITIFTQNRHAKAIARSRESVRFRALSLPSQILLTVKGDWVSNFRYLLDGIKKDPGRHDNSLPAVSMEWPAPRKSTHAGPKLPFSAATANSRRRTVSVAGNSLLTVPKLLKWQNLLNTDRIFEILGEYEKY
jgi:hypothetical protein